jgi:ABC-type sulfate/molybdate transport systems ATPase subunit
VLGANGAGKSTLLRVAGGLRQHHAGDVLLHGSPARPERLRRSCAAVLQRPLLRRGTVRANVETGLRFRRVPRQEARDRAGTWIERLGLGGLADQPAGSLSGGEAQRVSLARALALEPELLLLDEPFGALDAPSRAELLADLRDTLAASSTAALLVTHDRHEAAAVADRIAILHGGRLLQLGPVRTVLDRPADRECARLLGYENVLGPALAERLLGRPADGPVALRAADCRVAPDGEPVTLVRALPFGAVTRVVVRSGGDEVVAEAAAPEPDWLARLEPGDRCGLVVEPRAARELRSVQERCPTASP